MAHAVFDSVSLGRQKQGHTIERAQDFIESAEQRQHQGLLETEEGSLIDPEYNRGRDMFHTKLERILGAANKSLVFYDHPFNPSMKFISRANWSPKSGYTTVIYHRGAMPENTFCAWAEEKIPHPYNNHIDNRDDPQKQLFITRKRPGRILRKSWKRVVVELMKIGWLTQAQAEKICTDWGSTRDDARLAQDFGKV